MVIIKPFVNHSPKYMESSIQRARENGMTEEEAVMIANFIESKSSSTKKPISIGRKRVLVSKICQIRKYTGKSFSAITPKDFDTIFNKMNVVYSLNTLNETKSVFKEFFKYLIENKLTKIKLEDLTSIQKEEVPDTLDNSALLTPEEVKLLLDTAQSPMHKCLIAVLAESGARVGEVAMLRWKNLEFDTYGCILTILPEKNQEGKITKQKIVKPRKVRLIDSIPYIAAWKNVYPKYSEDKPVFITERGTTLGYELVRSTLARIGKKAGIKKRVNPHIFRHMRVTELLRLRMAVPQLSKSIWGGVSSKMLSRYEHLAGVDVDDEYLRIKGIETTETVKTTLSSVYCEHCHTINRDGARFCMICGKGLTEETRKAVQTDEERLFEQFKKFMAAREKQ